MILIETQEFQAFAERIRAKQRDLRATLANALTEIGGALRGKIVAASPRNTGKLASSTGYAVDVGGLALVVFQRMPYAPYMEFGTTHTRMPPPSALEPWVRRKLGVTGKDAARVAFLVARAILRRGGLAPRRYFRTTIEDSRGLMRAHLLRALREAAA